MAEDAKVLGQMYDSNVKMVSTFDLIITATTVQYFNHFNEQVYLAANTLAEVENTVSAIDHKDICVSIDQAIGVMPNSVTSNALISAQIVADNIGFAVENTVSEVKTTVSEVENIVPEVKTTVSAIETTVPLAKTRFAFAK